MPKLGRNDPCHCGSGKKYKNCCLGSAGEDGPGPAKPGYMSADWDFISQHIATREEFRQSEDFAWFVYAGLARDDEIELGRVIVDLHKRLGGLSGSARVAALYEFYEEKYTELRARDTAGGKPEFTCHAGCANCCKQAIRASAQEVEYIFDYLARHEIDIDFDRDRLERQTKAAGKVEAQKDQSEWRRNLTGDDQNCIFLDPASRHCAIYPARPLNCRNYFSVGSSKYCALTPQEIPVAERGEKQQVNYIELAQIATAYLNVSGAGNKYQNLAVAVAHRLKKN